MPELRPSAAPLRFWADRPLAIKGLVFIAIPLAILFAALASLYLSSTAEERAEADVRRAFAIQRDTYQVHALLSQAAAGVRGYALTGEDRFLEPYSVAERELAPTIQRLDEAIEDPGVRNEYATLTNLVDAKRQGLGEIVRVSRGGEDPASSRAVLEAELSASRDVLERLGSQVDVIQRREAVLLDQRRARVDEVRSRFLLLTAISALLGLLGSIAAVYLFSTGIVRRVRVLEGNAERLAKGERLDELPDEADEIGRLAQRLGRASALLRAREKELSESEERFRLVVDRVRDYGIFALDTEGRVATWNLGAERIKGWQASEILGRHFSSFYPPETRDFLPQQIIDRAIHDGSAEDEGWRVRRDGTRFWANVVITALRDGKGTLRGFAKVTRDMSERRRTEEELRTAQDEAIAASRAKTALLSRTSHELRTPMNAILGFGQLLEIDEENFAPHHRSAVTQIMKAGRHLLSLINDLLDISSIEAGVSELAIESFDLHELLAEVHSIGLPLVKQSGLAFSLDLPEREVVVSADKRRALQVVLNLIGNSAKYNRTGKAVRLSSRIEKHMAIVEVEDDGPGIDPPDVPRLFTAFDRLGEQNRSATEGTGLGLALSRSLVESMKGKIGYEPASTGPGRLGARFWFSLPLAVDATTPTSTLTPIEVPEE
ncbi:histidine kinase [Erythrobacter sp. HI0063]|jgi:PAS domain S-box-containing protein|uniref:sensor histidine kinase n=1 Tax=Erythrobacter sp. HI0063 TaxID=1822240 RepID=UPI0007C2C4A5|nr:ATP-binding protein [Erythrobacter sp. HI0063]KZY56308.1 histidine kinase [Erythrobacter sp. HI0063]